MLLQPEMLFDNFNGSRTPIALANHCTVRHRTNYSNLSSLRRSSTNYRYYLQIGSDVQVFACAESLVHSHHVGYLLTCPLINEGLR